MILVLTAESFSLTQPIFDCLVSYLMEVKVWLYGLSGSRQWSWVWWVFSFLLSLELWLILCQWISRRSTFHDHLRVSILTVFEQRANIMLQQFHSSETLILHFSIHPMNLQFLEEFTILEIVFENIYLCVIAVLRVHFEHIPDSKLSKSLQYSFLE